MKPHILILMHYMELGGAESALLGLLQSIDLDRVDVDLFIYSHRGELMEFIPQNKVRLLPEIEAYSLTEKPLSEVLKKGFWPLAVARLLGKWLARRFLRQHADDGRPFEGGPFFQQRETWHVLPKIQPDVEYDLAISFLTPHYVVLNNVRAKRKIGWIHTDYTRILIDAEAELKMWSRLDYIASISEEVGNKFCKVFPSLESKLVPIENILNVSFVRKRANLEQISFQKAPNEIALLTIGRFSPPKKMDEIPLICKKIIEYGVPVKWFIIGYGDEQIEKLVRKNIAAEGVQDNVIILGKHTNPYPFIKACDVYVQPSRYEGKSITVCEAQILCKPVIVTNYPTAPSQVIDGVDGIIVPMEVEACARQISAFLVNVPQRMAIVKYLEEHDYGNENEVQKIYNLLT